LLGKTDEHVRHRLDLREFHKFIYRVRLCQTAGSPDERRSAEQTGSQSRFASGIETLPPVPMQADILDQVSGLFNNR
jgi:hypothetical protein